MFKCIRDGQIFQTQQDYEQHCKEFHPAVYSRLQKIPNESLKENPQVQKPSEEESQDDGFLDDFELPKEDEPEE